MRAWYLHIVPSRMLRVVVSAALVVGLLVLAPGAQSHGLQNLILEVNYDYVGSITVQLPNGTPVGVKSGTPTVIPAGYYTVELNQPGCVDTPAFILQGPGVNLLDDMQAGEIVTDAQSAVFQPNSTYTWRDGSTNPPVYYTFQTNGDVLGTPPPVIAASKVPLSKNKEANSSVVGSGLSSSKSLGSLAGAVSSAGVLQLSLGGKTVSKLTAGLYSLTVVDKSGKQGFMLEKAGHPAMSITSGAFVGKKSTSVTLTAGKWFAVSGPLGKKTYITVVS